MLIIQLPQEQENIINCFIQIIDMGGSGECGICKGYKLLTEHHAKELGRDSSGKFPVIMICEDCHVLIEKYVNLLRDRHSYNPDK